MDKDFASAAEYLFETDMGHDISYLPKPPSPPRMPLPTPTDLQSLSGRFKGTKDWKFSDGKSRISSPSVLAVFETSGIEMALIMPTNVAEKFEIGDDYKLFYRKPVTNLQGEDAEDFKREVEYQLPKIAGDYHSHQYTPPKPGNAPAPVWILI